MQYWSVQSSISSSNQIRDSVGSRDACPSAVRTLCSHKLCTSVRVCGQDEYLCIPFVATVLRLADIIDFDPKRTPSVLFSHLAVKNPVSLSEWKKHQSINAWTISPRKLLFSAQCEHPAIEATILAFCNQIDEELRNGTVILSNLSDEGMDIDVEVYKISLPPQVDRRKIQAKKDIISGKPIYRYHDTKFSLSKKQIIDLLMGTKLYGKPGVALRELLQNSMNAKGHHSKLIDEIPDPDIAISMGCDVGCPFIGRPFDDDWGLMDPTGKSDKDFIEVIKEIEDKIIQLNNSL